MSFEAIENALATWALPVLLAITLHEAAHGWMAWKRGDDTAYRLGRVSFNPLRHIDPVGTILVPGLLLLSGTKILFGWAKPVPVAFHRLNRPRLDMVWVAAAGPGANLALALASALLFHLVGFLPESAQDVAADNLVNSVQINVVLAVFNMLPLPPLDGGRVAVGLLPRDLALKLAGLERHGLFIILGLMFILPLVGQTIGLQVNLFAWLVGVPADWLIRAIVALTGNA
ncbi:MAG: site-2 protease family protein [Alphaproteobacteria bacterium]